MKKNGSIVICYILIFILFVLIFVPPIIKALYPKEIIDESELISLYCEKQETLGSSTLENRITTQYKSDEIRSIKFAYTVIGEGTDLKKYETTSSILILYNKLLNINNIDKKGDLSEKSFMLSTNNIEVIKGMVSYNGSLSQQQTYYEGMGYSCSTISY